MYLIKAYKGARLELRSDCDGVELSSAPCRIFPTISPWPCFRSFLFLCHINVHYLLLLFNYLDLVPCLIRIQLMDEVLSLS